MVVRRAIVALVLLVALAGVGGGCASTQVREGARSSPARHVGQTDLLGDVKRRRTLLISTDPNYEPLSYRRADGSWHGFDVDVGREVARRLGVRPRFVAVNFDAITGGNWNGRWDVNVDSMTITRDRERVLYFTDPYYYMPAIFVVHKQSALKSIDDLAGKRIGVGTATTYQAYLEGHLNLVDESVLVPAPQARAVPYDTDELALADLALGDGVKLDAVLTSFPFAQYQIARGQPFRILGKPVFYEDAAVATDRNSPLDGKGLDAALSQTIAGMHADGTLARLSRQHFRADLTRR